MNKLFIVILLLLSQKIMSQNIKETVSYINTLLKASTYLPKDKDLRAGYDRVYDTIRIDEHGKLECVRFLHEEKTGITSEHFRFYTYLKSLQIGHKKDYSDYYAMTIECSGYQLCFGGIGVERTDVSFLISTSSNRDKLYNAFSHLIDSAKNNKDFYEKDPFGN